MSKTWNPEPNKDRIEKVLERRRSSAAGTHGDRRTKRLRTRGNIKVALRKELVSA